MSFLGSGIGRVLASYNELLWVSSYPIFSKTFCWIDIISSNDRNNSAVKPFDSGDVFVEKSLVANSIP